MATEETVEPVVVALQQARAPLRRVATAAPVVTEAFLEMVESVVLAV